MKEEKGDWFNDHEYREEAAAMMAEEEQNLAFDQTTTVGFRNIDTDKITSLEDVKIILKYMRLGISEDMINDDVAHLLED